MNTIIALAGRVLKGHVLIDVEVTIDAPIEDTNHGTFYCTVISQQLFTQAMRIYGASESQAVELAVGVVSAALLGEVLTDEDNEGKVGEKG